MADRDAAMHPATRARVDELVGDLRSDPVSRRIAAVVVCGSAARGEETDDDGGDIDVMVITTGRSPLVGRAIARVMSRHASAGIEGGQVPRATLASHRTLVNFEARANGVVVDGDARVLDAVAVRRPADIPVWEAVRLVLNRLFEHVKVETGETSADRCVLKSYEALGEAQLVLERRYEPSFARRWAAAEARPLGGPVADLQRRYAETAAVRRAQARRISASLQDARRDLLVGASHAIAACVGTPDVHLGLGRVARHERHLTQRVYWALGARNGPREALASLRSDPSLLIWDRGHAHVSGRRRQDPRRLLSDWKRCPQIYDPVACG